MKYIQAADIHFDMPFRTISTRANLGQQRRIDQREAFKKVIEYAKENKVDYLFLCGDIYEDKYVRESTVIYTNNLYKEIPETKVIIVPGNHDPRIKNCYYNTFKFADNVKVLTNELQVLSDQINGEEIDIYGYGFNDFHMDDNKYKDISDIDESKINIFISHGDDEGDEEYNAIDLSNSNLKKMDLILLGHIHKRDEYYAGSLCSLGFDEPGEHGFYIGEITKTKKTREFVRADGKEFVNTELDVSNINDEDELVEKINSYNEENKYYEIHLVGNRKFSIDVDMNILNKNIIKVKDNTELSNEIELKPNDKTLTGIFVKKLNEKLEAGEVTKEEYDKMLEGLLESLK